MLRENEWSRFTCSASWLNRSLWYKPKKAQLCHFCASVSNNFAVKSMCITQLRKWCINNQVYSTVQYTESILVTKMQLTLIMTRTLLHNSFLCNKCSSVLNVLCTVHGSVLKFVFLLQRYRSPLSNCSVVYLEKIQFFLLCNLLSQCFFHYCMKCVCNEKHGTLQIWSRMAIMTSGTSLPSGSIGGGFYCWILSLVWPEQPDMELLNSLLAK